MNYSTKQRRLLIEILESHRDEALSADRIAELAGSDTISKSSVYRNLSALESGGYVKRVSVPGSKKVFYRYTGSEQCKSHLHLECTGCGKTYHLNTHSTNSLISDVMDKSGFEIDSGSTMLHGLCKNCRKK